MTLSEAASIMRLGKPKRKIAEAAAVMQAHRKNRRGGRPKTIPPDEVNDNIHYRKWSTQDAGAPRPARKTLFPQSDL